MSDLKDILGNEILKEHFITAIDQKKVSHAYIIEGEKGSGKKMLSSAFAKILQCEKFSSEACGKCESCIQIEHKNHPDVIYVSHEKANVISVKEIREQIVNTVDIKPYKGPYKIYIIDEAEKMNNAAQNAILKTIEEPPSYAILILLTTNRGAFLPTILSRCILLNVKPIKDELVKSHLIKKYHVSEQLADFCSGFSMGNIGKAEAIVLSEEFIEMKNTVISFLKYIHEIEDFEIMDKVKQLKNWKSSIDDFLDIMLLWFRDILFVKAVKNEKKMIFKEECDILKKQSDILSFEGINNILQQITDTRNRIKANVNFDSSIELLFIGIKNQFDKIDN